MDLRDFICRCMVITSCVMLTPAVFAQSLSPVGTLGLKPLPDRSQMVDLPINEHWNVISLVSPGVAATGQGLKAEFGGSYGWAMTRSQRLLLGAGLGISERSAALPIAESRTLSARDVAVDLRWRWSYSQDLAVTSGVGVRYSLRDPLSPAPSTALRPSSATGYIGLQLKF